MSSNILVTRADRENTGLQLSLSDSNAGARFTGVLNAFSGFCEISLRRDVNPTDSGSDLAPVMRM